MKRAVPAGIYRAIRRVAQRQKTAAYLVGGPLRDVLLGRAVTDIDIAVEGDPDRFGAALSRELHGEFRSYAQFGTGTVTMKGSRGQGVRGSGGKIDVARTRTETYASSGALPCVRPAGIQADLLRRDFAINSMAWRLTARRASNADLVDPYHGLEDLGRGQIRVLYEKSLEDDPTRIFRAVRFAGRFGFRIEPRTRVLMNRAIREGRLKLLSGKRVMTELALVMQERDSGKLLGVLNRMGVFVSLSGAKLSADCLRSVARLPDPALRMLYLTSYLGLRGRGAGGDWPLTREQKTTLDSLKAYSRIRQRLLRAKRPSRVYSLLESQARDALRIKAALEPRAVADKIVAYQDRYSLIKPALTGQDFQRMGIRPGPIYTTLLDRLRVARLDAEVKTKKDEEVLVKTAISRMQNAKCRLQNAKCKMTFGTTLGETGAIGG